MRQRRRERAPFLRDSFPPFDAGRIHPPRRLNARYKSTKRFQDLRVPRALFAIDMGLQTLQPASLRSRLILQTLIQ